jgi:hypothetical protein
MIGYPQKSTDRVQYGAPDTPGEQLRVSVGRAISASAALVKQGHGPEVNEATNELYGQMVVSDADGAPGLSGGPTLNARGEVVGTYTDGYPADGRATTNHVSFSSNDLQLQSPLKN